MTWTAKPQFSNEIHSGHRGMTRKGAVYPWLPAIIDEETLAEITTFESGEQTFVSQQGRQRRQYLSGLYLKAAVVLGHFHFQPRELPLQFRRKMGSQLGCDQQLTRILSIDKAEKSRIVTPVRAYLGLNIAKEDVLVSLGIWLENHIARRETEIPMVVNVAVHYLRERKIEWPTRRKLNAIADEAIKQANENFMDITNAGLSLDEQERLESLTKGNILEMFKAPVPMASPNHLAKELQRIAQISAYFPQTPFMESTFRLHLERFAELTRRYTTAEIDQVLKKRQRALLLCYLIERHAQLLDTAADMGIRVWENTNHHADGHANARAREMAEDYEDRQKVLKSILKVIQTSQNPAQLWNGVHKYKSQEEYNSILDDIEKSESWRSCRRSKIEDHYASLRRFLPAWYKTISLTATVLNSSIPKAHAFMKAHDSANPNGSSSGKYHQCPHDRFHAGQNIEEKPDCTPAPPVPEWNEHAAF